MQIQVDTDHNIEASERLITHVETEVRAVLARFAEHLTRIDVHFSDQSAGRSTGDDQRCVLQARPAGRSPLTVTDQGPTVEEALHGAVHKLKRLLTSENLSFEDRTDRSTIRGPHH